MAVAYDAFSNASAGTGTLSWTHTPSGTPKGVFVWVCIPNSTSDQATGVTYGGVSMTEVSVGPVVRDAGETSVLYGYFLGAGLGTGGQTVQVSVSGSAIKYAWAVTVTGAADTELESYAYEPTASGTNIVPNPDVSLSLGGETCFVAIGWSAGNGGLEDVAPRSGWTGLYQADTGTQLVGCYSYDTVGSTDVTAGYDAASDDTSIIAVAIREAAGGGAVSLIVADATHAHTADGLTLTSQSALAVADATHGHAADNITLTTTGSTSLTVADATHAHTADAPTLTVLAVLSVADALHGHSANNVTLGVSGATTLTVADATHAHLVDGLVLTTASLLTVSDALHAHAADNLTLSDVPVLLIADALHAHTADGVTMTVDAWLVIADATHAHSSDNVVLLVPGGETWPDPATVLVGIMYGPTGTEYTGTLQTCGDTLGATVARIEKWLRNKRITDPNTGLQTVYDDDGVTVLGQGALYEDAAGTQPYRGQGGERAERLA